jgi:fimbrial chaperone protein
VRSIRQAAVAVFALCTAFRVTVGSSAAGDVAFSPTHLTLTARTKNASVTLSNQGDSPVRFEVRGLRWEQGADGQMKLLPTDELVVFPALLTIDAHASKVVRIADSSPPSSSERTFRLQISEIPAFQGPGVQGAATISLRSQFDLPVYYLPLEERVVGSISGAAVRQRKVLFSVANTGTVHFRPQDVRIVGIGVGGKRVFARTLDAWYVLAGGRRDYSLALSAAECQSLAAVDITVSTDVPIKQTIEVPPDACRA